MPRKRSLDAMEIQRRLIREDETLTDEVRRCLVTRSLGLQRLKLSQEEVDLGMGLIEARRALLATIPTLRGAERVHAVIRLQETIAKALGALRRRRAVPTRRLWPGPTRAPVVVRTRGTEVEDDEDNSGDGAAGGEHDAR